MKHQDVPFLLFVDAWCTQKGEGKSQVRSTSAPSFRRNTHCIDTSGLGEWRVFCLCTKLSGKERAQGSAAHNFHYASTKLKQPSTFIALWIFATILATTRRTPFSFIEKQSTSFSFFNLTTCFLFAFAWELWRRLLRGTVHNSQSCNNDMCKCAKQKPYYIWFETQFSVRFVCWAQNN